VYAERADQLRHASARAPVSGECDRRSRAKHQPACRRDRGADERVREGRATYAARRRLPARVASARLALGEGDAVPRAGLTIQTVAKRSPCAANRRDPDVAGALAHVASARSWMQSSRDVGSRPVVEVVTSIGRTFEAPPRGGERCRALLAPLMPRWGRGRRM
jgi:hypothetical protein